MKGCAFLNSCNLYIGLAPTQFTDDQARIYWVLSFMKGDRAAHFTNQTMQLTQQTRSLPWVTWAEFRLEFIHNFCPKNEVQKDWYDAAILCDENYIANSVFQSTL